MVRGPQTSWPFDSLTENATSFARLAVGVSMGQEESRRYGFGLSRDAHIAFVAVYLTALILVSLFGALRFWSIASNWHLNYNIPWHIASASVASRPMPVADPAFPAHRAAYTRIALRNRQEGDVLLELSILPDGEVGDAKVLKSSGFPQLDASALVSAGYWRYLPAVRQGKPVAATVKVYVRYRPTAG
jgi:TonB family protein